MFSYARVCSVPAEAPAFGPRFGRGTRLRATLVPFLAFTTLGLTGCAGHHLSGGSSSSGGATPTPTGSTTASGKITTIAGTGTVAGYTGDTATATSATLSAPVGTFLDSSGNLYIADRANNVVRLVTPAGIISTFAGTGTAGYLGDQGLARSAELSGPRCVFGDSSGNIYVVESGTVGFTGGNVVRKIVPSGIISTVAGTGAAGFAGDGAAATLAQLSSPEGGCIDSSGNIYIADTGNNRIRKITASTGNMSTLVGTTAAGYTGDGAIGTSAALNAPSAITVDSSGNLYVCDKTNNRVRKVIGNTDFISTIAGSGTPPNNKGYLGDGAAANLATLNLPSGVAVDSSGNVYIADLGNNVIRKISVSNGFISTVAGNGTAGFLGDGAAATAAKLRTPTGVSVDSSGNLYIADTGNDVIREVGH